MKKRKFLVGVLCALTMTAAMAMTGFGAVSYTPMPFDGTVVSVENQRLTMNRNLGWGCEEMIVNLTEETRILDAVNGYPVQVDALGTGEAIRVYVGETMTMSLPPIANGVVVLCDVPADAAFPVYTDVQELASNENGTYTLKTIDGTTVTVNEHTMLLPYLTRNMVRAEDLKAGTRILLWTDDANTSAAVKIVVFQQETAGFDKLEDETANRPVDKPAEKRILRVIRV